MMMEKVGEDGCQFLSQFNLFSQQNAAKNFSLRKPKPPKAEIKIVFQHPNLLYLSDKRVRTREELSKAVEEKIIGHMRQRKTMRSNT